MGDECHSRNVASSALLTRALAPGLARHADLGGAEALDFLRTNDYWFLNFSMVASKLGTMAGHGVEGSTVVTTFARNGVTVGIRVSGLGEAWFTAPAAEIDGLYFAGYGPEDANPDIGDSAIAETYGLGGFALAAAPAIVGFVGGTPAEAIRASEDMATITVGRHREYQLPAARLRRQPGRDRRPPGRRLRPRARHHDRHRAPRAGDRADRRGADPRADGVLHRGARRVRPAARRRGLTMAAAPPEPHHRPTVPRAPGRGRRAERARLGRRARHARPRRQRGRRDGRGQRRARRRLPAHDGRRRRRVLAGPRRRRPARQHVLNATGRAASAATREAYAAGGAREIAPRGPRAALTVPGAVDGWAQAHARFGRAAVLRPPAPGDRPRPRRLPARGLARPLRRRVPRPARRDARHRRRLPASRRRRRRAAATSSACRGSRTRSRRSRRAAATRSTPARSAPRSSRRSPATAGS